MKEMNTDSDWKNFVSHVIKDNEIYVQYGHESEPGLIEYIQNPTPEVIYYSIILKETVRWLDISAFLKKTTALNSTPSKNTGTIIIAPRRLMCLWKRT